MFKSKTFFSLISSAIVIIFSGIIIVSCSFNNENEPEESNVFSEQLSLGNDTVLIETNTPIIQKSSISSVSEKTREIMNLSVGWQTRASEDTDVYYLYDEWTEKWAYAVANPTESSCIFECYGSNTQEPIFIIFEQVDTNEFVTKDESGNILRHFTYDPDKRELKTYNNLSTRGMSTRDKILCNTMFAMANYIICEGLAIPTGGASLLVGIGFAVASTYICD